MTRAVLLVVFLALPGCARELQFGDDSRYLDASSAPEGDVPVEGDAALPPEGGPHVTHTLEGDVLLTRIDAQSADDWVYVDLDTGLEVMPETPENDAVWDVAFRRSNIAVNGGVTGIGAVEATSVPDALANVTNAPASGYVTDALDSDDDDTLPDYAFRFWYLYDVETHVLTPDAITYVVRTTAGAFVKLQMAGYYDSFGTSGRPSFRWQRLP